MYRNSSPDWLQTLVALFGLVFMCWILIQLGGASLPDRAATGPIGEPARTADDPAICADVVQNCVARAEVVFDGDSFGHCSDKKAHQRIESALRSPLDLDDCKGINEILARNCPEGCELLPSTQLLVPGKTAVDFTDKPNEAGKCLVRGQTPLRIRATCVKQPQ